MMYQKSRASAMFLLWNMFAPCMCPISILTTVLGDLVRHAIDLSALYDDC